MSAHRTLVGRLVLMIGGGFLLIWLLAVAATTIVLGSEQREMLDIELRETADLLLPVLSNAYDQGLVDPDTNLVTGPIGASGQPDEDLVFALVDSDGGVVLMSGGALGADLPSGPPVAGYAFTDTHAFYTTPPDGAGLSLRFGDPLAERREAFRDSLFAFGIPMLAFLPLALLLIDRIARLALRPLAVLAGEIEKRSDSRLDPIDAADQVGELRAITAKLNEFMIRLAQSLDGERAFATNAAHELRSPVAVVLAQVQRLRIETTDPSALDRIGRLEAALRRMRGLVARLLQLARAEAGIGPASAPQDLVQLLGLIHDEMASDPSRATRLQVQLPDVPVLSRIDPDAYGIVAGNLIENALQHAPADSPITITLSPDGALSVANPAPIIALDDLHRLTERFYSQRTDSTGFGLGLYICDRIARQSGGELRLNAPIPGKTSGFEAVFRLPLAPSHQPAQALSP